LRNVRIVKKVAHILVFCQSVAKYNLDVFAIKAKSKS